MKMLQNTIITTSQQLSFENNANFTTNNQLMEERLENLKKDVNKSFAHNSMLMIQKMLARQLTASKEITSEFLNENPSESSTSSPGATSTATASTSTLSIATSSTTTTTSSSSAITSSESGNSSSPTTKKMPIYTLSRDIASIADLWKEWKFGLTGSNKEYAVEKLEKDWGAKWRNAVKERQFYKRRKKIIDHIVRLAKERLGDGDNQEELDRICLQVVKEEDEKREAKSLSLSGYGASLS